MVWRQSRAYGEYELDDPDELEFPRRMKRASFGRISLSSLPAEQP